MMMKLSTISVGLFNRIRHVAGFLAAHPVLFPQAAKTLQDFKGFSLERLQVHPL
jgi:hypothetical protein